jgi:hypothetical protein
MSCHLPVPAPRRLAISGSAVPLEKFVPRRNEFVRIHHLRGGLNLSTMACVKFAIDPLVVNQQKSVNHQVTKIAPSEQNNLFCSAFPSVILVKLCALGVVVVKHLSMPFNRTIY